MTAVTLGGIAHGGEGVGRLPDGRAVFVAGALPGEDVQVEVVDSRKRWARARLLEVLTPSPDRVTPPCPYYGTCGGCQLQHAAPAAQAALKRRIVSEQLSRLGRQRDPIVAQTVRPAGGWPQGYRTTARFAVTSAGALGFRRAGSHELVAIDRCLLLDAATQAAREGAGDAWGGATEVTIRTGDAGAAVVVARRATSTSVSPPAALRITVGGTALRVSPTSFFQPGPAGAAALVAEVVAAAAVAPGEHVLDLYGGVGVFAVALSDRGARVTVVESHRDAAADAEANLAGRDAVVVRDNVERVLPRLAGPVDVVVLDPPRSGAGAQVVALIAALRPRTIVYVACDVAALARDTLALTEAGFALVRATPVDQFGHTAAIETVAVFAA